MPTVHVLKTETYDRETVYASVKRHFEAFDVRSRLKPETRVLIKPNLLAARRPETAATTHPAIVEAVIRLLREYGVTQITVADSPGGAWSGAILEKLYKTCGYLPLEGSAVLNRDTGHGKRGKFQLIVPVLEADYIINCAKLKTHGLTVMTAGVKNLFGCIPGLQKPEWHCRRPDVKRFSRELIALCETVKPDLTLLDAVDCMEGNGPGGGNVRHMGYTLCAESPYALDEAAARLMGFAPEEMPLIRAARQQGLPGDAVLLSGDEPVPAEPPFLLPDAVKGSESVYSPKGIWHVLMNRQRAFPVVETEKCIGCGRCAESCPRKLITVVGQKAEMKRRGCISCFCCQEMCPAHAIGVEKRGGLWQRKKEETKR